jgi:hypothetical protein
MYESRFKTTRRHGASGFSFVNINFHKSAAQRGLVVSLSDCGIVLSVAEFMEGAILLVPSNKT